MNAIFKHSPTIATQIALSDAIIRSKNIISNISLSSNEIKSRNPFLKARKNPVYIISVPVRTLCIFLLSKRTQKIFSILMMRIGDILLLMFFERIMPSRRVNVLTNYWKMHKFYIHTSSNTWKKTPTFFHVSASFKLISRVHYLSELTSFGFKILKKTGGNHFLIPMIPYFH